jgi:hypothetical protein
MADNRTDAATDGQVQSTSLANSLDIKNGGESRADLVRPLPMVLAGKSPEELKALEKKLLRKVDRRLLPTMILIYIMNYLDR